MTTCLITGGCGFIGSNLADKLHQNGWQVVIVDNLSSGKLEFLPEELHKHVIVDDFSSEDILKMVRSGKFDYIFHLAANPSVKQSVDDPILTNDNNVSKTLKLMFASLNKVEKFIFSSSSAIYGNSSILPTTEDSNKNPMSPYGLQKKIIEDYLILFNNLYNFPYISLRYFNVYGKNQIGGSAYSTAVSSWLFNIKYNLPLRSDGDGNQTRDMCHVEDVVSANILAAISGKICGEYNVGTNRSVSNNDILKYLKMRFPNINISNAPARKGDVLHTLADISKSERELEYYPSIDFWLGLEKTIDWVMNTDLI
jgi:UDP-glucose 4-epimerase